MNPTRPISLCVMAIVALSLLGLPIGHAMIGGSVLYLFLAGLDMGTAAEQLLNGMYSSFVLLAIPLFILAAEFMTIGSITERLLSFCNAFVGRYRRSEEHTSELQSHSDLVCRLLLEKKKKSTHPQEPSECER